MKKIILRHEQLVLFGCFVVSRLLASRSGVYFGYEALATYWQYLDITSLQHHLLKNIWYMHSQPPLFNLLAGMVLQASGEHARSAFQVLWLGMSFFNASLLLRVIRRVGVQGMLPLLVAAFYLLSPATILFENELFYTTFTSLLLLLSVLLLQRYSENRSVPHLAAFLVPVALLCLTRSLYHLAWLAAVCALVLYSCYKRPGFGRALVTGITAILVAGSWYLKNYLLFGVLSVSSWTGINFSRVVFHDVPVTDSASIAAIHPFLPVSYYKLYISSNYQQQYAGMDDRILLREMKSDTSINMNNAGYLQVSEKYMQASLHFVRRHPASYIKNVCISFLIFFTPASSYFQVKENCNHIAWYDMMYSFNLSHLFGDGDKKKMALVASSVPKFLLYLLVMAYTVMRERKSGKFSLVSAFILFTILFVLVTGTLMEYGENMRFRYEVEPLFLVLCAGVSSTIFNKQAANRSRQLS